MLCDSMYLFNVFFSVSIASEEIFSPLSRTLRDRCGLIFKSHTRLFFQIYRKRTSIYDNMSHVECVWGEGGRGSSSRKQRVCDDCSVVDLWIRETKISKKTENVVEQRFNVAPGSKTLLQNPKTLPRRCARVYKDMFSDSVKY